MKNTSLVELKNSLYSNTESGKTTIYYAIAYCIVYHTSLLKDIDNLNMAVKEITGEVCELAILDRVMVEKSIKDLYLFTNVYNSLREGTINTTYPTDFESALFITSYISKDTITAVNENMGLFNNIVQLLKTNIATITPDD